MPVPHGLCSCSGGAKRDGEMREFEEIKCLIQTLAKVHKWTHEKEI